MSDWSNWYETLSKPSWTPASGTIGMIWTVLYPVILVAFGAIVFGVVRGSMPRIVLVPVLLNVATNLAFTPIQFGLRNLPLAAVDILLVLATVVWTMVLVWPHARWIAIALVPYLLWVSIATVLQLYITFANRTVIPS